MCTPKVKRFLGEGYEVLLEFRKENIKITLFNRKETRMVAT
jgi:hypothetical protein